MLHHRSIHRAYGRVAGRRVRRNPPHPRFFRRGKLAPGGITAVGSASFVASHAMALVTIATLLVLITVVVIFVASYNTITASLNPRLLALKQHHSFETSRIYDRNGTLLYEFYDAGKRTYVSLNNVSPLLVKGTIAIEDKTFYTNTGIDMEGIIRAFYQNFTQGEEASGASTITQQLIKNVILTDDERQFEKRYERKFKEIILALELNKLYTKDNILELYLNEVYYGNMAYGIEAASQTYFNTSAYSLTLAQASLLSGLPQLPSRYAPINHLVYDEQGGYLPGIALYDGWLLPEYMLPATTTPPKWRQIAVLRQMVDEGYVSEEDARRAAAQNLRFEQQAEPLEVPHFVFYVRNLLEEKYGKQLVLGGGLHIYTTLDLPLQHMVQQQATEHIERMRSRNLHNAAVVVMQPNTGHILAMVGSVDYNQVIPTNTPGETGNVLDGQVNITTRERHPGSALKPFTYLAAMERGMTPATVILDTPTRFNSNGTEYSPQNYTHTFYGSVRIRGALANSLNIPAVAALDFAGINHMLNLLDRVGIKTGLKHEMYGLALTLGGGAVTPLELTTAFNTLASGGKYYPPNPILAITDSQGNILESSYEPQPSEWVIDPALDAIIVDMMSDDRARAPIWGMGSRLNLSHPSAVKTGTSEDWRDAWALGFNPFVTVGVWTGNNNNEPSYNVESIQGGGVIWHNVMEEIFTWADENPTYHTLFAAPFANHTLPWEFTIPDDGSVVEYPVCGIGGGFAYRSNELLTREMVATYEAHTEGRVTNTPGVACDYYDSNKRQVVSRYPTSVYRASTYSPPAAPQLRSIQPPVPEPQQPAPIEGQPAPIEGQPAPIEGQPAPIKNSIPPLSQPEEPILPETQLPDPAPAEPVPPPLDPAPAEPVPPPLDPAPAEPVPPPPDPAPAEPVPPPPEPVEPLQIDEQ